MTGNEAKKRIYPANFVDAEENEDVNIAEDDYDYDEDQVTGRWPRWRRPETRMPC